MSTEQSASLYATAKICGYNGSFDDFKKLYDQYYSEVIETLPVEEPQLAEVNAAFNPFSSVKHY